MANVKEILHRIYVFGNLLECHGTLSYMPKYTSSICYTGASYGLKKFKSDYVHYIDNEINVKDVTNIN